MSVGPTRERARVLRSLAGVLPFLIIPHLMPSTQASTLEKPSTQIAPRNLSLAAKVTLVARALGVAPTGRLVDKVALCRAALGVTMEQMGLMQMVDVMINELGIGDGHCLSHGTTPAATTTAVSRCVTAEAELGVCASYLTYSRGK